MPQPIQWYPGHIAKAERQLKEQLNKVDVVFEVLDARIPLASHHPQVPEWIGDKPRILVVNRMDMITAPVREMWRKWFKEQGEAPYFTDGKTGKGVNAIGRAAQTTGQAANERRLKRGMRARPVRAVVIGFPNVGKSALINRLVGKKAVASARRPGVTRQLQWVKISPHIELLDAPGVIPWQLRDQGNATKLAICEDIGEAAYENQHIAAALIDLLVELASEEIIKSRYGLDPIELNGEALVFRLGELRHHGETERAAVQILNDFRKGILGQISLELPPLMGSE